MGQKKIFTKKSRSAILIIILILTVTFAFLNLTRQGRAIFKLAKFAINVIPVIKYQGLEEVSPPAKVSYPGENGLISALLFQPNFSGKTGGVILSGGVGFTPDGTGLLLKFADILRKVGFNVLIPLHEDLTNDIVSQEGIKSYVAAFEFLEHQPNVNPKKIGFLGLCAGGSIVILAAANEKIADKVAFVSAFAPYANLADLYLQALSQTAFANGQQRSWQPNSITWQVLLKNYFNRLRQTDAQILEDFFLNDRKEVAEKFPQLSDNGKQALEVLAKNNLDEKRQLMEKLPPNIKKDLAELSPLNNLENLSTKVFIIHDQDDNYSPIEESYRLTRALKEKASFVPVQTFNHTVLDEKFSFWQFLTELPKILAQYYQIFYLLS